VGDHVYVAGGPGLNVCLRECGDVVAIFVTEFTVTWHRDAVQLHWTLSGVDADDEFRVVGRQVGSEWPVPVAQDGYGNVTATDDVAGWVNGEPRNYLLYYRSAGVDWMLLATETIEPTGVALQTGLRNLHPNPFNPATSVCFTVDRAQHVTIAVYDLAGRQIAPLADQVFGSGEHTVHWDGRDDSGRAVSSGTYIVRFEAERRAESRKIMLVR
jgi:hypothetical protein